MPQNDYEAGIFDAKRDAGKDVNKKVWAAGGFGGCMLFYPIVLTIENMDRNSSGLDDIGTIVITGCCLSSFTAIPMGVALFKTINVSPERLIGKSPEYIDAYTAAYKRNVRMQRFFSSGVGYGVGYPLVVVLMLNTPYLH